MSAVEASQLANYFSISTEMLLNEDLSQRFELREDYDKYLSEREKERQIAERHGAEVARAPYLARAVMEDYIKAIAKLTGEAEPAIRARILDLAQQFVDQGK